MGVVIWRKLHAQRLALNMLWCAFLLWPFGSLPRETISGFFGRKSLEGSRIAALCANFIDRLHPHEPRHCNVTAGMEYEARVALQYDL
jgi:hypothetical protein